MKIVLAEDRGGKLQGEHSFATEVVRVGRDPAVCHYFFSQEQWPMVSRKHAEFRLENGRCLVADTNSRFGTFVNGEKVSTPVEVRVGSHVQLGAGGPILRVVSIEQTAKPGAQNPSDLAGVTTLRESQEAKAAESLTPKASPLQEDGIGTRKMSAPLSELPPENQLKPSASSPVYVELFDSDTGQAKRIHLDREVTRLGARRITRF